MGRTGHELCVLYVWHAQSCWVTSYIKREAYPHLKICQSFLRRPARHQLGSCGWIFSLGQLWLHKCLLQLNVKVTGSCMCTASKRCLPTSLQLVIGTMDDTSLGICKKWAVCLRMQILISWLVLLYVDIGKMCGTQSQQISLGNKLIYAMANLKVVLLASASQLSRLHAGFSLILCVSVCLRPSSWCLNLLTVKVQHWLWLLNTKRRDWKGESWMLLIEILFYMSLKKHINRLVDPSLELIIIVNRKVADFSINVADTVKIGEEMTRNVVNSSPEGFHKTISGKIKTMETMQRGIKEEMQWFMTWNNFFVVS